MDKLSRVIFTLLFFIASLSSEIRAGEPSAIAPSTAVKAQGRSSAIASVTTPAPVDDSIQMDGHPLVDLSDFSEKKKIPCTSLHITTIGAVCDGYRLDFPEVNMQDVLEGESHLPRKSGFVFVSEKFVGGVVYRNLTVNLRWEPATPEFLQIHLEEYLPYWGDRIPYRLYWNAQYEACRESCAPLYDEGEFLPADIEDLSPSLAADINFNGVPVAFWNENIKP